MIATIPAQMQQIAIAEDQHLLWLTNQLQQATTQRAEMEHQLTTLTVISQEQQTTIQSLQNRITALNEQISQRAQCIELMRQQALVLKDLYGKLKEVSSRSKPWLHLTVYSSMGVIIAGTVYGGFIGTLGSIAVVGGMILKTKEYQIEHDPAEKECELLGDQMWPIREALLKQREEGNIRCKEVDEILLLTEPKFHSSEDAIVRSH